MASITYVALRSLDPTGYGVGGADISAAAGDQSFNATVTTLVGLLNDQWIQVSGFLNAANNGWFQASADSTVTKVSQDTSAGILTEAAGRQITLQGYYRGFGQSYSFDFGVERADRSVKSFKKSHQPLASVPPETIVYRDETYMRVRTGFVSEANLGQWREFLGSVSGGEVFTFDRYGMNASPIEPKLCILTSDEYSEDRINGIYPSQFHLEMIFRVLS